MSIPLDQTSDPPRLRMAPAERRAVVVAAGAKLFAERGYAGTTIDEVAAAAGVTKPIVYRHFDSKKALYLALLAKHREDLPGFLEDAAPTPGATSSDTTRSILERWFAYVRENSHAWEMLFRDGTGDDEIRAVRREVSLRAREVLAGFIATSGSGLPPGQVEPAAELLRSGLAGLALWSIDNPGTAPSLLVDVALRFVSAALRP